MFSVHILFSSDNLLKYVLVQLFLQSVESIVCPWLKTSIGEVCLEIQVFSTGKRTNVEKALSRMPLMLRQKGSCQRPGSEPLFRGGAVLSGAGTVR